MNSHSLRLVLGAVAFVAVGVGIGGCGCTVGAASLMLETAKMGTSQILLEGTGL